MDHGQPLCRRYFRVGRWPEPAASADVSTLTTHPFCRANRNGSSLPRRAKLLHTRTLSVGRPHRRLYRNWDTEESGLTKLVNGGRLAHASLQDLDTVAKKRNCFSATNSTRQLRASALIIAGLSTASSEQPRPANRDACKTDEERVGGKKRSPQGEVEGSQRSSFR